ncbi:MAG: signal recognition particle protein [Anderseniella sp.]|jgi:signal recognition particle subunit SRP54|nr:signal recognition particle protein [Anderseniella sp.]
MFETLQDRLSGIFDKLTGRGALSEADVDTAMREVRRALIEADVALEVVRAFVENVKEKAVGREVIRSVTPGQMVVKIVNDALVEMLGKDPAPLNLKAAPPVPVLMVGLQGSGKTTTTAKIAKRLKEREKKKVLMASLDTRRPAAQEQLAILGEQIGVDTLPIVKGEQPAAITKRAMSEARKGGYDVVMLDTAGRLFIDEELMAEVQAVRDIAQPVETLLVADALTGQDAVNLARSFDEQVGITGLVLTRIDGDGRGGAALSMRAVTGKPIKLLGTGEKLDGLEDFHPERIASRILGMGDVVSLVEKAAQTIDADKAQKMAERLKKGQFDLDDLADQIRQMQKMGGMSGLMGMMPGMGKVKKQLEGVDLDNSILKRQLAMISSMTKQERRNPKLMNASRKKRVAKGAGVDVQDINRLLKMHLQMSDMMKKMRKGKGGLLGKMMGMGGGAGMPSAEEMEKMQAELAGMDPSTLPPELREIAEGKMPQMPKGLPGLGGMGGGLPGGLPGLGGKGGLPGLGGGGFKGLPGFAKKKK